MNQYVDAPLPPPPPLSFAPQPQLFSAAHQEEAWNQLVERLGIGWDQEKKAQLRARFDAGYARAKELVAADPDLLRATTRIDRDGLTRVYYHGPQGDVLIYEAAIGSSTDCAIWWISFSYQVTIGFFQAMGLVPGNFAIAGRVAKLIQGSPRVMAVLTSLAGKTITVSAGFGVVAAIYKAGLTWPLLKLAFSSAGWYTLLWILKKVIAIALGIEAADVLAEFIVWAAKLTTHSLDYPKACGGRQ
jgi:hypothetical protein